MEKLLLVIEFMGHKTRQGFYKNLAMLVPQGEGNSENNCTLVGYDFFNYNKSWDMLIPVIAKIASIESVEPLELDPIKYAMFSDDIDTAYQNVVEIVKTLNHAKKQS